jgi:hypothetical protein
VCARDEQWLVDYGSYVCGYYDTRAEALAIAIDAARDEHRELVVDAVAPMAPLQPA